MSEAVFRFYQELNDFLPAACRKLDVPFPFEVAPSVKDAMESLGVPHVEVDLIVVDGVSVDFGYRLQNGDRIAVYPVFEAFDITPVVRLRGGPLREPAFVVDVHLGKLGKLLRLLGFDVADAGDTNDAGLVRTSVEERRILLTRDRQLLKHGALTHGTWVRSTDPIEQAREILQRFDLHGRVHPFSRCLACGGTLRTVEKDDVLDRIPSKTAAWLDDYVECSGCGKLFWEGTHWARVRDLVSQVLESPPR